MIYIVTGEVYGDDLYSKTKTVILGSFFSEMNAMAFQKEQIEKVKNGSLHVFTPNGFHIRHEQILDEKHQISSEEVYLRCINEGLSMDLAIKISGISDDELADVYA